MHLQDCDPGQPHELIHTPDSAAHPAADLAATVAAPKLVAYPVADPAPHVHFRASPDADPDTYSRSDPKPNTVVPLNAPLERADRCIIDGVFTVHHHVGGRCGHQ